MLDGSQIDNCRLAPLSGQCVLGVVAALGVSVLVAVAVTGPVKTWNAGEALTAADLNSTITSLKAAIESIPAGGGGTGGSTESLINLPTPRAGTFKSAMIRVYGNTLNVTCTVTLRKNGANTAISISVGPNVNGDLTDADSVPVVVGDAVAVQTNCPIGSGMANLNGLIVFE